MNILISGAGIAGPALAYWLTHHGLDAAIVERAPRPRTGGQAVDIRGTAREVVDRMGLLADIRARHTGTHGVAYVDRAGRHVARLGGDDFGHSGGIIADLEILRADLMDLLHRSTPDTEYIYGDTITAIAQDDTGVTVTFEHAPARRFDLVVGADGVRSTVRGLAFGAADRVVDGGYYSALFPARTGHRLDGWELMYSLPAGNGVDGRLAMLYPIGSDGELRVMLAFAAPDDLVDRRDTAAQKALLRKVFHRGGWLLPELLDQLSAADDLYFARAGKVRMERWTRGRVVLLGDAAAGGSLGLGTSIALVGAYVLAGELASADHRTALDRYAAIMAPFAKAAQQGPPGELRGFLPRTAHGIRIRNAMMRALPHLPGRKKMMAGIDKTAHLVSLADYPATVACPISRT